MPLRKPCSVHTRIQIILVYFSLYYLLKVLQCGGKHCTMRFFTIIRSSRTYFLVISSRRTSHILSTSLVTAWVLSMRVLTVPSNTCNKKIKELGQNKMDPPGLRSGTNTSSKVRSRTSKTQFTANTSSRALFQKAGLTSPGQKADTLNTEY